MDLTKIYQRLLTAYGPQHWWPGDTPFEVIVGAMLVQNTNWKNVEKAIANLRDADLLEPHALVELPADELEELVRPAGYFRVKARRLLNLMQWLVERFDGALDAMFQTPLAQLRAELLGVNGVGPETADSILLYAGNLPTFVVDTYTYRVTTRHGWIGFEAEYEDLKGFFESSLPDDVRMFNEFHALLVRVGKEHCGTSPKCAGCPLAEFLPAGGPQTPE
jgi:endonuclease III related protein